MQGKKWQLAFAKARHPALTVALVLLISLCLALWRQNGSSYATGLWDDGSQALVFGRMLQVQQNQSAPGGFMGVYTQDWGDAQNRYLYRENAPVPAAAYMSYTHQSGLQGAGFALLNKLLSVVWDAGEERERILYTLNSVLFYAATLGICLAVARAVGRVPALAWAAAALLAPWVQRGMKDLYWCLWTWLLPALAGLALCAAAKRRGKAPLWAYALVFLACLVRCMCGFEFISVFLILCEIPLVYCWASARTQHTAARPWVGRMVWTGAAAVGGVAAALLLWLAQGAVYFGSVAQSWQNITGAVTTRVSVSDDAVRAVGVGQVIAKYLADGDAVLRLGGFGVSVAQLLGVCAAAILLAVLAGLASRRVAPGLWPLCCVWGLSLAAPLSWMVLSKAHADIHVQLIPMLWHFAFVPASCMLLAALGGDALRGVVAAVRRRTNQK